MGSGRKKRKVRVAFHKNREKRARTQNLTRRAAEELNTVERMEATERLSGKGRLTRYRTVVADTDADKGIVIEVDESRCEHGRVLSAVGANNCRVEGADGRAVTCTVRRVVRTMARDARNAVVAGDEVLFSRAGEHDGVIERVEPRRSTLARGSGRYAHIIAANIDQAVIVASLADPPLKVSLIDRFLCSAHKGNVRPIICLNKIDLVDPVPLQPVIGQYAQLGYAITVTNALTGEGADELKRLLAGKQTVFAGQSGVGKSSLLNSIDPGLARRTSEVSSDSRKGKHTTRVTELQPLESGGWVIDTPGIRQLQLWDILPEEVEGLFVEFAPFVSNCRFSDCSHIREQGCGVREAVDRFMISPLRYESYVRIVTGDDDPTAS